MNDQGVVAEFQRIYNENGGILRAVDIVNAAREETSPLHSKFEWDDTKAAEAHRLHQARQLISVVVNVIGNKNNNITTRVWVSLSTDRQVENGGYRTLVDVMTSEEKRAQLLADALAELHVFQQKYSTLQELDSIFSVMRKITVRHKKSKAAARG